MKAANILYPSQIIQFIVDLTMECSFFIDEVMQIEV